MNIYKHHKTTMNPKPKTFQEKGLQISITFSIKIIDYIDVLSNLNYGTYLLFVNITMEQPTSRKIIEINLTNPFLLQLAFESDCLHSHH